MTAVLASLLGLYHPSAGDPSISIVARIEGKYRCGAIENKVGSSQHDQEVRLQLQAKIMLLCAKLLSPGDCSKSTPSIAKWLEYKGRHIVVSRHSVSDFLVCVDMDRAQAFVDTREVEGCQNTQTEPWSKSERPSKA